MNDLVTKDIEQAKASSSILLQHYPNAGGNLTDVFIASIIKKFSQYPAFIHAQAIERVVAKCRFVPSVAELTYELEQLMTPLREAARQRDIDAQRTALAAPVKDKISKEQALEMLAECKRNLADPPKPKRKIKPNLVYLSDEDREVILSGLSRGAMA